MSDFKKVELLSRLTACQSTLTINETSITKFEKNQMISKIFGNSIQNSFNSFDINAKNEVNVVGCSASNNGYEKNLGAHTEEIILR